MISIAVVDDEQAFRDTMDAYLTRYQQEHQQQFQVDYFPDGLDIADSYQSKWDIILLDIQMQNMDGMAAARRIRKLDPNVVLIFITTLGQYAITGYEVNALDFVLKPVSYAQFELRLIKAIKEVEKHRAVKYLFLKKWNDWVKISTDDILYIEVKGHTLLYVTTEDVYERRATIGEAEEELQGLSFARCSLSFLVNLKQVDRIQKNDVVIGTHQLPISRNRKKEFLQSFSDYLEANF